MCVCVCFVVVFVVVGIANAKCKKNGAKCALFFLFLFTLFASTRAWLRLFVCLEAGRQRRRVGTEEGCEPRAEAGCAANYLNARIYLTTADVGQDRRREATAGDGDGDGDEAGDGVGEGLGYVRS